MKTDARKKRSKSKLTKKERRFAEGLAKDLPVKTAALIAGYAPATARTTAYAIRDKNEIIEAVQDIRERNQRIAEGLGYGPNKRIGKFCELIEAKKTISAISGKNADGRTVDFVDVPDSTVQLNAAKELSKLCGDYPADKLEIDDRRPVRIITNVPDPLADAIDITPDEDDLMNTHNQSIGGN